MNNQIVDFNSKEGLEQNTATSTKPGNFTGTYASALNHPGNKPVANPSGPRSSGQAQGAPPGDTVTSARPALKCAAALPCCQAASAALRSRLPRSGHTPRHASLPATQACGSALHSALRLPLPSMSRPHPAGGCQLRDKRHTTAAAPPVRLRPAPRAGSEAPPPPSEAARGAGTRKRWARSAAASGGRAGPGERPAPRGCVGARRWGSRGGSGAAVLSPAQQRAGALRKSPVRGAGLPRPLCPRGRCCGAPVSPGRGSAVALLALEQRHRPRVRPGGARSPAAGWALGGDKRGERAARGASLSWPEGTGTRQGKQKGSFAAFGLNRK